jgi:hypothetical protein
MVCERPPASRFAPGAVPLCEGDTHDRYSGFQRPDVLIQSSRLRRLSVRLTKGDSQGAKRLAGGPSHDPVSVRNVCT